MFNVVLQPKAQQAVVKSRRVLGDVCGFLMAHTCPVEFFLIYIEFFLIWSKFAFLFPWAKILGNFCLAA